MQAHLAGMFSTSTKIHEMAHMITGLLGVTRLKLMSVSSAIVSKTYARMLKFGIHNVF